jgi:hypothetical protein
MKRLIHALLLAAGAAGISPAAPDTTAVSREEYMSYCVAAAEEGWNSLPELRDRWKKSIDLTYVFGYNPPGTDPYLAALSANLWRLTGEPKYLGRIKQLLLEYPEYKNAYPAEFVKTRSEYAKGLPALPNIFTFPKYLHAYALLKGQGNLTPGERKAIEDAIAESADFFLEFQEWGAMNRALLRAEALLYAAKLLPAHARSGRWRTMGEAILRDSWGQWEIEDATGYHSVWLYSLLGTASDVREDESLYRTPVLHYYFRYFLELLCPAGNIPDFGDADWDATWERMIPFFEKGGAVYGDPELRWAAARIFRKHLVPAPARTSVFVGLVLSDALRWADFTVGARSPAPVSGQVLEDLVGKKVVFRDGRDDRSTYMLYNYRDEGDGAWLQREYLRTTIPVEEEKMHHGHSDENSIVLLMRNGSILLHDGGYRDFMPSGPYGAFRADYFHNRLVVRDGKIALGQKEGEYRYAPPGRTAVEGQTMLEFFRNSGAYRQVRTQLVDFVPMKDADVVRTRLTDSDMGYTADRIVTYVKELDWFVVFDVLRYTRATYLTMANLWHTRKILSSGAGWYDTAYDSLRTRDVSGDERLLVVFPERAQLQEGVARQRRYWQEEHTVYQMIGRHGYQGDLQAFVTVLIPHGKGENLQELVRAVRVLEGTGYPDAAAVEITRGDRRWIVGAQLDLQKELVRDWRRPMYTYESGRTVYGDFETDAYFFTAAETSSGIHVTMVGGVKLEYRGRVVHEQLPALSGLAFDGSPDAAGTGKVRVWEDTIPRERP